MTTPVYEVVLEKKGRGRGFTFTRPWAVRNFKLKQQTLEYYDASKFKGSINIKNAQVKTLTPKEADEKPFPFVIITTTKEHVILNASSDLTRQNCIDMFNTAANDINWTISLESLATQIVYDATNQFEDANKKPTAILREESEISKLKNEEKQLVTSETVKALEGDVAMKEMEKEEENLRKKQQEEEVIYTI
jgi:hypothetical protein